MEHYTQGAPFIKITSENMRRAAERARQARPTVKPPNVVDRLYKVSSSSTPGAFYTVRLAARDGHLLAACDCLGGEKGYRCPTKGQIMPTTSPTPEGRRREWQARGEEIARKLADPQTRAEEWERLADHVCDLMGASLIADDPQFLRDNYARMCELAEARGAQVA